MAATAEPPAPPAADPRTLGELVDALVAALAAALPPTAEPPAALTPEEAARRLGIGRSTLDTYASAGVVPPPAKFGAFVRYCRAELDAWLAHGSPPASEWAPVWKKLRDR